MIQVDPREEYKMSYVYPPNYPMPVDTSQQPPLPHPPAPLYPHQLIAPPPSSPAHLYQLSYFPNQPMPQSTQPTNSQQPNTVMYYPYSSVSTSNQYPQYYSPYIQVTIKLL